MSPWDCQPRSGSRKSGKKIRSSFAVLSPSHELLLLGDEATEADHLAFAYYEPDNDWPESDFRGAVEAKEVNAENLCDLLPEMDLCLP